MKNLGNARIHIALVVAFVFDNVSGNQLIGFIYLPGTGWIDFDPTSGRVGKSGLVTVAVVRNPHHATPLQGTFIGFPSDPLGMEVQVSITPGTPEAICATPQRSSRIQSTRLIDTGWNASKVR